MTGARLLGIVGGVLALSATGTAFADHDCHRPQQSYYSPGSYNPGTYDYGPGTYRHLPHGHRWQARSWWETRPQYRVDPYRGAYYRYRGYRF